MNVHTSPVEPRCHTPHRHGSPNPRPVSTRRPPATCSATDLPIAALLVSTTPAWHGVNGGGEALEVRGSAPVGQEAYR